MFTCLFGLISSNNSSRLCPKHASNVPYLPHFQHLLDLPLIKSASDKNLPLGRCNINGISCRGLKISYILYKMLLYCYIYIYIIICYIHTTLQRSILKNVNISYIKQLILFTFICYIFNLAYSFCYLTLNLTLNILLHSNWLFRSQGRKN